jgi:hypothetical protein
MYLCRRWREIEQNLIQIEKIISHTENSIFITHTDRTDLTDLYLCGRLAARNLTNLVQILQNYYLMVPQNQRSAL